MIRQSADEIHTSSTLMLRLVDDLLDTSRLDAGRIQLKPGLVELDRWLARVATGFGQATPSHRVVAQLPTPLPSVSADLDSRHRRLGRDPAYGHGPEPNRTLVTRLPRGERQQL